MTITMKLIQNMTLLRKDATAPIGNVRWQTEASEAADVRVGRADGDGV